MLNIKEQFDALCESNDSVGDNYKIEFVERNPHIYAFKTESVKGYLKVGYTDRPVSVRLKEWEKKYKFVEKIGEWSAKVESPNISDEEIGAYFMDHAVHEYIKRNGPHYISDILIPHLPYNRQEWSHVFPDLYYSEEFFEKAKLEDIEGAIEAINKAYPHDYTFYTAQKKIQVEEDYERIGEYEIREIQQEVIDRFNEVFCKPKKESKHTNLLMYAVMRFGKTFTALCCARAMKARVVVVVSAKADVRNSWKENVQKPGQFGEHDGQNEFVFVDDSKKNRYSFRKFTEKGVNIKGLLNGKGTKDGKPKNVVIFLTLQNLQKEKERLQELKTIGIDMLVVDETHYGARGERYGQSIGMSKTIKTPDDRIVEGLEKDEQKLAKEVESLKCKVMLHLSGTPYHILADRESNEFRDDNDIIGFFQYSNILQEQKKWDEDNFKLQSPKPEWKNPYYGFPQMIRFAFNPGAECRKRLKNSNIQFSLSELFAPCSVVKDAERKYETFKHTEAVESFLKVIDGKESDEEILSFLDYPRIKECKLCQHIVIVLPNKSSCDALEVLLNSISKKNGWNHWHEYEILNIAGWNTNFNTVESVQRRISEIEVARLQSKTDCKTKSITLTVNHMLTGVTVEEWDTMIFLKNSSSAQEYDQAVFRLQNTYVRELKDKDGKTCGKINMKPQTLLVDFDPTRMFLMQMQRSMMGALMKKSENVEKALEEDLMFSPIIALNAHNVSIVKPTDIVAAVRRYAADRSIMDEALSIPNDSDILSNETLVSILESTLAIDNKKGFSLKPHEGEEADFEFSQESPTETERGSDGRDENKKNEDVDETKENISALKKKLATHRAFLLLYVFLSDSDIHDLNALCDSLQANDNNKRIFKHLNLDVRVIKLLKTINKNTGSYLYFNQAIADINAQKKEIQEFKKNGERENMEEHLSVALKKFNRMGNDEVVTPTEVAKMVHEQCLKRLDVNKGTIFLDVASKQGEFTIALLKSYRDKIEKNNVYAIATSNLAYELTRKVYVLYDIPVDNIFNECYQTNPNSSTISKFEFKNDMKFDIVVGNPPYVGKGDPLYMKIVNVIFKNNLSNEGVLSLIHPTALVENKYKGNTSYESLKAKYNDIKILDFYYDASLRDKFGAMIGNGIGIFTYAKNGQYNLFDDYLKRIRFADYDKDKEIIEVLKNKKKISQYADNAFFGFHGTKDDIKKYVNAHSERSNYVVMAYNRGHIDEKTGGYIWDWTTLQSEEYLVVQTKLPYIALNAVEFKTKEEAVKFLQWTLTDFVSFVVLYYKYFMTNNPSLFENLPQPPASGDFSDEALCKEFGLKQEQMDYIHKKVKDFGWKKYFKKDEAELLRIISEKNK